MIGCDASSVVMGPFSWGQFQYTLEFRKTNHHQNADALSRLPSGKDPIFDKEKEGDDSDVVCTIETLSQQI